MKSQDNNLRDEFAKQAMLLFQLNETNVTQLMSGVQPLHTLAAKFCYDFAEAMIKERAKYIVEPVEEDIISFGKHKGTPYSKVPREYLTWLRNNLPETHFEYQKVFKHFNNLQ